MRKFITREFLQPKQSRVRATYYINAHSYEHINICHCTGVLHLIPLFVMSSVACGITLQTVV